jgi:hypothetical protein
VKKAAAILLVIVLAMSLSAYIGISGVVRAAGAEEGANPYSAIEADDMIQFGGYDWRVLEVKDGKALILSDKILDRRSYHKSSGTWETSEIRQYLNGQFYDETFTEGEKNSLQ